MKLSRFSLWRFDSAVLRGTFFYITLFLLPFGRRKLLAQFTGGFDEYETLFLYVSDIFLVLFLLFSFRDIRQFIATHKNNIWFWFLAVFGVASLISVYLADYHTLSFFSFLRLVLLILFSLGVGAGIASGWIRLRMILLILILLGIFEAALGFSQFTLQRSVGLSFLGEPNLPGLSVSPNYGPPPFGIAKIDLDGGKLTRAYGTFPHPNILAAFLLLALISLFYFWIRHTFPWNSLFHWGFTLKPTRDFLLYVLWELFLGVGIFIVSLGLLFSFSRAAWALAVFAALAFSFFGFLRRESRRQAIKLFLLSLAIIYMLSIYFGVLVFPRVHITLEEPAVTYRLRYDEVALDLTKTYPLGVGIGNQVIYSVKNEIYQKFGMFELWEWQPIHNIYLLMASEIGIVGALAFLVFVIMLIFKNFWHIWKKENDDYWSAITALGMIAMLLLFGLVDHFLWTLQPGRLMLWVVLGIMIGISCPRSSTG